MTEKQMRDFVQSRLDPVLEKGYYSTLVNPDYNSLKQKRIRNSTLFFRTSSKPGAVEGIDVDYISLDEYDRVNPAAEASAEESMSSSKFGIRRRWSTPSIPDMGIHKLFEKSDQHYYLHKCEHCNHWNQMSYDEYNPDNLEKSGNMLCVNPDGVDTLTGNVVDGSFQFVCQKCGKPLDRWYNGEWVAKYPSRTQDGRGIRGYSISQMNAVWISADDLKRKEFASESKKLFYNYVLGYPYLDTAIMVTDRDVLENYAPDLPGQKQDRKGYRFISVGIDWGKYNWVSVHGMRDNGQVDLIRLFSVETIKDHTKIGQDFQRIIMEISKYKPDVIIADNGDSGDRVMRLINHFGKGKVFGCTYKSSPKSSGQIVPVFNDRGDTVTVDKLMQNKMYIDALKYGEIKTYKILDNDLKLYLNHWKNVVISDEQDDTTGQIYQTISRRGDDHYAQASVYAYIGLKYLKDLAKEQGTQLNYTSVSTHEHLNDFGSDLTDLYGQ